MPDNDANTSINKDTNTSISNLEGTNTSINLEGTNTSISNLEGTNTSINKDTNTSISNLEGTNTSIDKDTNTSKKSPITLEILQKWDESGLSSRKIAKDLSLGLGYSYSTINTHLKKFR